jgi:hypothetical protein
MKIGQELIEDVIKYIGLGNTDDTDIGRLVPIDEDDKVRLVTRDVLIGLLKSYLEHRITPEEIMAELGDSDARIHKLGMLINSSRVKRIVADRTGVIGGIDEFISDMETATRKKKVPMTEEDKKDAIKNYNDKVVRVKTLLKLKKEREDAEK